MKTKTINLYEFHELPKDVQDKVIQNQSGINTDGFDWWDTTYEDFRQLANYFGFDVDLKKTWFTLSYGQGDGSSYTADVDVLKMISCIESEGWKEYAQQDSFILPAINTNVKRICKLIAANVIDFPARVYPVNRETNVSLDTSEYSYVNSRRLERVEYAIGELHDITLAVSKELNRFLLRQLQNELEYLSSRQAIIETIEANGYTFTENGKMENL